MTNYDNYITRLGEVQEELNDLFTITKDIFDDLEDNQKEQLIRDIVGIRNFAKSTKTKFFEW